jgi:hypothetical protein
MQTKGWGNVPDGSTLVARVQGDEETFIATGTVFIDGNAARSFSTADLVGGVTLPLRSPHRIVLEIDVILTAEGSVEVTGSVSDPAGEPFGSPFAGEVSGANGDHDHIELTALTRL